MTRKLLLLITVLFIIPFAYADDWPICIDKIDPEAPGGLSITGNVDLTWTAATDEPECSSIDYYKVNFDDTIIYTTDSTSFNNGPLAPGTYQYKISAVDKAGNEGQEITGTITITATPAESSTSDTTSRSTGGGGGGSSGFSITTLGSNNSSESNNETDIIISCTPDWSCSDWGDCEDGFKERICSDSNNCETDDGKPAEKEECTIFQDDQTDNDHLQSFLEDNNNESESIINQTSEKKGLTGITGAFLGSNGTFNINPFLILVGILGVILLAYFGWGHYKKK